MSTASVDTPLLATKLFVPPPRENRVTRTRLRDRLAAMRGGRVTLIAAAAGWGKSTLLGDWALDSGTRVAWLSLDPHDDEPRRFLSYLIASLRGVEAIAEDDLAGPISGTKEGLDAAATELLNAVALRRAPVSLVLDDYHSIGSRAVHDLVQFIIDHLPPNLHLVIATRADPPLGLSRLRARGLLLELRGDDLRFTPDEAGAFLNGAMGLGLEASAIDELERRTEGWVVGLQMAAISLTGRGGAADLIHRFSGTNRFVLDYLTEEVLNCQPEEVRRFLLETSILSRLSAPLCDAVRGRSGSEDILRRLDAANLFLIPLDDVRYWYRYHHLFGTLLQHQLARGDSAQEIAELHRRASAWYEEQREPEPALDHAMAAKDVDRAMSIVRTYALARTLSGDAASAVRWFDVLPKERIEADLELLLIRTVTLVADYQLQAGMECVQHAEALLTEDASPKRRGALLGVRGAIERMLGQREQGMAKLRQALPLVDRDTFWYSQTTYQIGMDSMSSADVRGVIEGLEIPRSLHSHPDQVIIAVLAQTYTASAEWWRGNASRAVVLAQGMFEWIDLTEKTTTGRPLDAFPFAILAEAHLAWNELDAARGFAEKAVEHGRRGFTFGLFESSRSLARVAEAQRDWEMAMRAAHDARQAIRNAGPFYWFVVVETLVHRVLFRRGLATGSRADLRTVEEWLEAEGVIGKMKSWEARQYAGFYCDAPLILAARVMNENGRYDEAIELLDEVWVHAAETERVVAQIESLIVRAMIEGRRGRQPEAVDAMHRALELASRPRYIRYFADEGSAVLPIVERAAARVTDRNFATKVLASFDLPVKTESSDALSERELEVLKLVASGASNQEAANKLFIASSTVKKHLENIYAKLAVGGRTEAIARAREMKLL